METDDTLVCAIECTPEPTDSEIPAFVFVDRKRRRIPFRIGLFLLLFATILPSSEASIQSSSSLSSPRSQPSISSELLKPRGGAATKKGPLLTGKGPAAKVHKKRQIVLRRDTSAQNQHDTTQNRILMLIKVLFLCYYGSLGSLMPYLPVYYHSLGHGGLIIGMLGAVKPLTTFLVAPFWGILSDKTGDRYRILYFTFLVSFVAQLMIAFRHDAWYLAVMVFITAFFNAPVKSLIDTMVMDNLPDRRQYGRLRLWGQLGFGLGSSGVGILLSKSSGAAATSDTCQRHWLMYHLRSFWESLTGYKLLFSTYAALSIPTYLCLKTFERIEKEKQQQTSESKQQKEGAHILDGLRLLVQNGDALLFFFLVFVVGVSSGCIENFAYVRMREVGGSGKEMGLSRLVSSAAGAPMFWFSGPLTEKLGADRVLTMSLLSYVVRFFIYAFMRSPYHGLPAEAMRGVTFAAFWSTGTIYAHRISPPGMSATMLMFLNAMYGGLGQSLGAIIGGKMQSKFGTVQTFVYSGIFDLFFVGFVMLYLGLRKDSSFRNPTPIGGVPDEKQKKSR